MTDDDDLDPVARMNREEEQQQLELADLDRLLDAVAADYAAAFNADPLGTLWFGDTRE